MNSETILMITEKTDASHPSTTPRLARRPRSSFTVDEPEPAGVDWNNYSPVAPPRPVACNARLV